MDFMKRQPAPGQKIERVPSAVCDDNMLVGQVPDLLEHLGIEKLDLLIGHSMGGATAIALASRCPDKLRRLLVTAPAGLPESADRNSFSL
eukprot:COSAG04_NODE_9770_length_834_cov_0.809524_1_plen_90_part_00